MPLFTGLEIPTFCKSAKPATNFEKGSNIVWNKVVRWFAHLD